MVFARCMSWLIYYFHWLTLSVRIITWVFYLNFLYNVVNVAKWFVVYFCHIIFVLGCLTYLDVCWLKELIEYNTRQHILLYLPRGTRYSYMLIAQSGKRRSTFKCSIDISTRSARLSEFLRKLKVPGLNPTFGKNFSFCNSRFALPTVRLSPCKWNQPWYNSS